MSYSGHIGGGFDLSNGAHSVPDADRANLFGWVSLSVVVLIWSWFGIAMWAAPGTLIDVWEWAADLSMAFKVIVWVLGLPWMIGLAVWQSGWSEAVRAAVVAGLALVSIWSFYPNRQR